MLKVGDIIVTRNVRVYFRTKEAKGWGEYKAEKGKYMTFVYFGQEPMNGTKPINVDEVLNQLGWE